MTAALQALPGLLDRARVDNPSLTVAFEQLLAIEVAAQRARQQQSLARFSCLPAPWRIADFDFDAQKGVDRKLVTELATLRFMEDATKVLFIGPPGVGKTMLAVGLATSARSWPALSILSPSASLRTICSGVWRLRFTSFESSLPMMGFRTRTTGGSVQGDPVRSTKVSAQ